MSVSVADLLAQPHLRLELLAGGRGLTRPVTWAHSSDSSHPWDWLSGGELLLKNGESMPRVEMKQVAFLRALADTGVSGLVIGDDPSTPFLRRQALACADALALPVLKVPFSMSFIVLTRAVADAHLSERITRISTVAKIYDSIRQFVITSDPHVFITNLIQYLDANLYAVDAHTGEHVLPLPPHPNIEFQRDILPQFVAQFTHATANYRVQSPTGKLFLATNIPYEEPTYLIVEIPPYHDLDPALLQHVATAVAVVLAHIALQLDHERRLGAHLLADLLDLRIDRISADQRLMELGLPLTTTRIFAIRGAEPQGLRMLHICLFRNSLKSLIYTRGEVTYLLVVPRSIDDIYRLLQDRLGAQISIGISAPLKDVMELSQAVRESLWALARVNTQQGGYAIFGDASPTSLLDNPTDAEAIVNTCLGDLIHYDKTHHTELLHSLEVFLQNQRSWSKAALALNVHRQTVIYRMTKVSDITGRDLSETADIAELWIAIVLLHTLTGV